jgi:2-keto-3-deoxy-L-rhamnonate aldolase RhmA
MMRDFTAKFTAQQGLLGSFLKTPAVQPVEILSKTGLDFIVIDEEHAPFNPESVDHMILAARASGIAPLVRVPGPEAILRVLDCGAEGVLVPHVSTPEKAAQMVNACFYLVGRRGFSPSGRAGAYGGVKRWDHMRDQDRSVAAIAMIEDPEALDHLEAICATPGLTGLFIGRGDLTASLGASAPTDTIVTDAVAAIIAAGKAAGKPVMMMVESPALAEGFAAQGATAFITGSDQSFMKRAATQAAADYAAFR